MREGLSGVSKQLDTSSHETQLRQRDMQAQTQQMWEAMNRQEQLVQVRLEDLHRRLTDLQERLTGIEGRLGTLDTRLDTRLQGVDDRLNTRFMGVEGGLSAIEQRLDHKADRSTVNLWCTTLAILIAAATALIKFVPSARGP